MNARLELEKEIKRLQDEVAVLIRENQQLKRDKEDVEQQFMDFRTKNEDIVVKLRGKPKLKGCFHLFSVRLSPLNHQYFPVHHR